MSHSKDLRERVIRYVEQGGSINAACKLFEVSRSSFQRWRVIKDKTGQVSSQKRKKVPYKIDNDALRDYVTNNPEAYLSEIASHFNVTSPCILVALRRLKITRKKNRRNRVRTED